MKVLNSLVLSPVLPIAQGGTGASTAATVLTNLGITATAAELNKMDGVTATATQINYTAGVTSSIQGQLNAKAPLAAPALTGYATLDGKKLISNATEVGMSIDTIWTGTQAQYNAISPKLDTVLYFIAG